MMRTILKAMKIFVAVILMSVCNMANSDEMAKRGLNMLYDYESVETYQIIPEFSISVVEARCTEGKKVLGGGYTLVSGGDWQLQSLGPSPDGAGYYLEIWSLGEEPQEVKVTAMCAYVSRKFD